MTCVDELRTFMEMLLLRCLVVWQHRRGWVVYFTHWTHYLQLRSSWPRVCMCVCVRLKYLAWFVWTTKIPLINDLIIDSRPALSATATIARPPEFVHTRANHCRVHPHAPPPVYTPWQISCFECRYMRETQQTWVGMGHLHRTLVCERCERTTNWNLNLWMFLRMLVCS